MRVDRELASQGTHWQIEKAKQEMLSCRLYLLNLSKDVKADFMVLCINNLYDQPVFLCCCWDVDFMPRPWPESCQLRSQAARRFTQVHVANGVWKCCRDPFTCTLSRCAEPGREDTFLSICCFVLCYWFSFSAALAVINISTVCDTNGAGRYGKNV